ncbi:hypothetical protein RB653_004246 [Dictyostelium firmibasis]|uniref:GPI ethanolamine phosphate transferase 1 n=1 Tax=Dictyostelium firmibasis TaxID=79012 RepID=A0AAN7YWV9_9MYCE
MYHITSSNINNSSNKSNKPSDNNKNDKTKFNSKILVIVLIGIIFHAVFTLSIFDIYFRSPLVHGMTPHPIDLPAPAKRLVLFVADGLRADKFFEIEENTGKSRSPFLRDIVENKGSWGISHTRVPTETRPGHVALIAGFYEDVSAVTKGWKANPVEFDHLFNETIYSFGYGSPDVLPMFSEGVPHMQSESYPEEAEDFASDASKLDTWVFDKVQQLLLNASTDQELNRKLRSEKVSIFLHLLGLDTNGHAYRPNSKEYFDNIALVDRGIEKIVKLIEEFYGNDGKTAYVFTADHGMSNRGSHGDGERANTETPLVVWGSGVRGPLSSDLQMERVASLRGKAKEKLPVNMETPSNWRLSSLFRSDVSQADIAPLMSSLLGVPSPLNSVGVLPTELLSEATPQYTTVALRANTLQIWEMYKVKSSSKQQSTLLFFSPFTKLSDADKMFERIEQHINLSQWEDAQILCHEMIELCLMGLNYFQTYDRPFLMTVITLGYFGWIITLSLYVLNNYTSIGVTDCNPQTLGLQIKRFKKLSTYLIFIESIALIGFLLATDAPLLYYLYCVFLVLFWAKTIPSNIVPLYIFLSDSYLQVSSTRGHFINTNNSANISIIKNFLLLAISAISVMELLVVSYFHRGVLSLLYQILGVVSILFFYNRAGKTSTLLKSLWLISCLLMSIFPSLPIDYGSDTKLVCFGGVLISVLGILTSLFKFGVGSVINNNNNSETKQNNQQKSQKSKKNQIVNSILIVSILLSSFIVYTTDSSLEKKIGLPYINQILSWFLLVSSILVLAIYRGKGFYDHWTFLCLGLSIPFLLLSISYEVLFFGNLILNLTLWMYFELKVDNDHTIPKLISITSNSDPSTSLSFSKSASKPNLMNITQHDIRRAIFYIFFCYVGFFGVGNIASISSFEISSTYRFTTIFSPFLMGALLLIKIFIPLLLVAISFSLLNNNLNVPRPGSFLIVIALTDIMSINFFFLVKDTGSWLEIGVSISHYAISNAFIILQLLLFAVSSLLVPTTLKYINKTNNNGIKSK